MSKARMIQTLAATPPYLPGAIELNPSDEDVKYGIEIKDAAAVGGVLVLLLAYLNQSVYDAITLYLNGRAVDNTTIAKGEEDDDTPLFIPPAFLEKGHNSLEFGVKRISQNEEFTPEIQVLFHDTPPGGTPSVLNLSISHSIIGKEDADDVLATLRYANMRWWDWIYLSINGTVFEHRLEPDSTNPPPPVPDSVYLPVLRAMLEQAGNNPAAEFKFRVKDRIGNHSGAWSNSLIVDVNLNRRTLPEAVLREILSENNDNPYEIDLAKMNGGPLWALIHLIETVWASGDSMVLTFTAELGGSVVATHSETVPVTTLPTQFAWEIPNPKVVPESQVTVVYQQVRGGAVIGSSKAAVAQVTEAPAGIKQPSVVEAPDLNLDPNQYQQGFTVSFDTNKLPPGAGIELTVVGRPGEGSTTAELKPVNGQQQLDFNISAAITGANLGRAVALNYRLITTGTPLPVQTLDLKIGTLLEQNMPRPIIEGAAGETLDIPSINDNTKVLCGTWPFQRTGLPIWLSYEETRTDGSKRSIDQLVGTSHDQEAGLSYTTEVQWLRECKSGSKLEILLKVGMFRGAALSDAVECQTKLYVIKTKPGLDDLTTFTDFDWNGWTSRPAVPTQIIELAGEYFAQSVIAGTTPRQYLSLEKPFILDSGDLYELSFTYQCEGNIQTYVVRDGAFVYDNNIPASNTWRPITILFYAAQASPTKLALDLNNAIYHVRVDNIRLRKI
ncbi:hypothetical protein [Pseudomonas baetica]|uniref:hypothetical protein n=1 Tax=Pseudomonas baetica TaxID=674054 RepID=UPI0028712642|nr:hypothetical protein [Pseudomonas baetica]MDR9864571.1 hypothetical protein [Pseudomonas baetica]